MERDEFKNWIDALQTYYPRFNIIPNPEAISLWYAELGDIPYDLLNTALRKWVNTEKWPPTISELRELCAEIVQGKLPDWGEAWREVEKAIGRYGYDRSQEAFADLSPLTRQAVERIGWRSICMSGNTDVIRAQFRQVFEICAKREIENRLLPAALRDTIKQIGGKSILQLEERK